MNTNNVVRSSTSLGAGGWTFPTSFQHNFFYKLLYGVGDDREILFILMSIIGAMIIHSDPRIYKYYYLNMVKKGNKIMLNDAHPEWSKTLALIALLLPSRFILLCLTYNLYWNYERINTKTHYDCMIVLVLDLNFVFIGVIDKLEGALYWCSYESNPIYSIQRTSGVMYKVTWPSYLPCTKLEILISLRVCNN